MENHKQTVTMQMYCSCQGTQKEKYSLEKQGEFVDLKPLYQRFAQTLELQLQKLSEGYQAQIDTLNSEIFSLKNTVQRLQIRNKKDNDAQKQLRRQYNILLIKLKDLSANKRQSSQVRVVQRIKEVRVESKDEGLLEQIRHWKQKCQDINQLYQKIKSQKETVERNNANMIDDIQRLKKSIDNLKKQLEQARNRENLKQNEIQKLQNHNQFLKTNKQVIVETKHFFPDFKPSQKIRPQTKIETIYIQKPIEKVVVLQVEKRVKEFIQPERPLVNRIISCEPLNDCKCKETDYFGTQKGNQEVQHLNQVVSRLENNIKEYKNERQKLVSVIDGKNRQLNSLETHLRLLGRSEAYRGPSSVNVTVTKLDQPISQRVSRAEFDQNNRITVTQAKKR